MNFIFIFLLLISALTNILLSAQMYHTKKETRYERILSTVLIGVCILQFLVTAYVLLIFLNWKI